ncbi:MAG: uroporphyrinogen decarboxylase [Paludibacteraceae bacterium]|nr:uroporphyrinogen decarboxylase [Paludibacteraceae bacterium]
MGMPLFTNVLNGYRGTRPPVWYMRQAGRVLPNYRKLRERYTFEEMMNQPQLAAEVTLMPVYDLGVDASIVFSDILTVPVAMGMELMWTDHGPQFKRPLMNETDIHNVLHPDSSKLNHVYKTLDLIKKESSVPTIGFCGAPLTTLCYMLQGTSAKHEFPDAKSFFYTYTESTRYLVDMLTDFSIEYALKQIEHGIDAFQLFDTHAGIVPQSLFEAIFLPAVKKIASAVRQQHIPFIYFPKGLGTGLSLITPEVCDFVSIDWLTPLSMARKIVHADVGLQGNIDPYLLLSFKEKIVDVMHAEYVPFFQENDKWIINLGHGALAATPFENIKFLTDWIKDEQNWR